MIPSASRGNLQFSIFFFAADSTRVDGPRYGMLLECARFADANGFAAVWTPERHFEAFGGLYPSPSITTAALAMTTSHLQLRAGSVVLPFHDPIRIAEDWSMIDNLSGGRVAVSFASGWHVNDFVLAPTLFSVRREDMLHKIAVVQKLWRGEKIIRSNGCGQEVAVAIRPRPVQAELPIWLTCQQDASFATAAELGFNALTNFNYKKLPDLERKARLYHETIQRRHGRWGHLTLMAHTYLGEFEADVEHTATVALRAYIETNLEMQRANALGKRHATDGGMKGDGTEVRTLSVTDQHFLVERATKQFIVEAGLIGTVEACREKALRLYNIGVDEVACLVDFGVPVAEILRSLQLVSEMSVSLAAAHC